MHYALIAIGSRGDVQPFIALAIGLIRHGHPVTLLAHENFKPLVESYQIDFHPLTGNPEHWLQAPEGRRLLQSGNTPRMLRYLHRCYQKIQPQLNQDPLEGCQPADVLVTSALGVAWVSCIAEKTGKRWAMIQLSFPIDSTSACPFAGLDYLNSPAYNRWTYRFIRWVFWHQAKRGVKGFRQSLGLPRLQGSIFDKAVSDRVLTLYAVSPALMPRPKDWEANIQVTGFLSVPPHPTAAHVPERAPETLPATLPESLAPWLQAGGPPVYIGFGSMPIPDPALFIRVLEELLTRTSHRYILCTGWTVPPDCPTHSRLFVVPSINHEWLLPQCKAAVIHGGAGTLAATLRAGIPPVIVSIYGDQHWWGKYVEKKKLGRHIPFKRLNTKRLIAALDSVLAPSVTKKVTAVARQLKGEDGVGDTVAELERYFSR